jgi:hypothetical protein
MKIGGYESDELKCFHRVLEAAIAEARARSLDLPVHEMTRRLFAAADRGERSPEGLRVAILREASGTAGADEGAELTASSGRLRFFRKRKAGPRRLAFLRDPLPGKRSPVW